MYFMTYASRWVWISAPQEIAVGIMAQWIQDYPNMLAKKLVIFCFGLSWLATKGATGGDEPQGRLLELHSCEVYAGACMVSSESTTGGRNMLQVWDIAGGSWQGINLKGIQMAVLESASENLALPTARADQAIVYFPKSANPDQRSASLAWLKSRDPQLATAKIQTRTVPISLTSSAGGIRFQAGKFVSVRVAALPDCQNRGCGESLWYEPSTPTSLFSVALNADARVYEPLLSLSWKDFGKRSVFVARFGTGQTAKSRYVESSDWCSPTGLLF
jgi:hypothetical protein